VSAPLSCSGVPGARFSPELMYAAARLYYLEDKNQAAVAQHLGTSRATVSRLLSEARRAGIVRIEVNLPERETDSDLEERTARALGIDAVYLSGESGGDRLGAVLAPALSRALLAVQLGAGDVLLVSSGRTVYEAAQFELPYLPGVVVAPMVGGQDEPAAWYQTNEITRELAAKIGGRPSFLYAPALPGPDLYLGLQSDPSIRRVLELWSSAACAVVGIGAPTLMRESTPAFVPTGTAPLRAAVGDVCSRLYDRSGRPVDFPGSERLIATDFDTLRSLPVCIAVAVGAEKVLGITVAAKAGFFNRLVTDPTTAALLAETPAQRASTT
jgi:DNA-binding transcriptional regulator LsrR (DeoR family)